LTVRRRPAAPTWFPTTCPRERWETARQYAEALARAGLDHPHLPTAVTVLEAEQFSGEPVTGEQRRLVEEVLEHASAR